MEAFKVKNNFFSKAVNHMVTDIYVLTYEEVLELMLILQYKGFNVKDKCYGFAYEKKETIRYNGKEEVFPNVWDLDPIQIPSAEEVLTGTAESILKTF